MPVTVLVASDAPIAAETPDDPTATEAATAATVASIEAVLVADSARVPVESRLDCTEASVRPPMVFVALAPPPLRAAPALPAEIDTAAEMQ